MGNGLEADNTVRKGCVRSQEYKSSSDERGIWLFTI